MNIYERLKQQIEDKRFGAKNGIMYYDINMDSDNKNLLRIESQENCINHKFVTKVQFDAIDELDVREYLELVKDRESFN